MSASIPKPIDLKFLGIERAIASYAIDTRDGLAIVDCGPQSTLGALEAGLAEQGASLADVRHILLTHIHFDHAGAAGSIVRRYPQIRVHVAQAGARHIVDPAKLEASARRLWPDNFDELWGEVAPVPEANVQIVATTTCGLTTFATPGHAIHHVSFIDDNGTLFAGDLGGVRIAPARYVVPATPPPDVDLEAWDKSLTVAAAHQPERLALPHWGVVDGAEEHFASMREQLALWAQRVHDGASQSDFVAQATRELLETETSGSAHSYHAAGDIALSWLGLRRYWKTRKATEGQR